MELVFSRAQELCGSRRGRPGLHVPNSPYGLCGRTGTLEEVSQFAVYVLVLYVLGQAACLRFCVHVF